MNCIEAIYQVLTDSGEPLRYDEITRRVLESKLWQTEGATPDATINARLAVDIRENGASSRFQRTAPGMFALRAWGLPEHSPKAKRAPEPHNEAIEPATPVPPAEVHPPAAPQTLTFTDAAEVILKRYGGQAPMHYRVITEKALELGLVKTTGKTPEATLYAQVLTETQRRTKRGEIPRFVMHGKGLIGLSEWQAEGLALQIERHNAEIRKSLHAKLLAMHPEKFEALVGRLLVALGFEDAEVTSYGSDGGIDVRGTLIVGDVIRTRMAVQVKRWRRNVQIHTVQQVRGSLGAHEQGLIITTSDFSVGAKTEAARLDAVPVALMDGEQLVRLLVENQIGVSRAAYDLIELDGSEEGD